MQRAVSIPHLHAFGPVAHVFPQKQVVQGSRTDKIKQLLEDLCDELRINSMNLENLIKVVELKKRYKRHV